MEFKESNENWRDILSRIEEKIDRLEDKVQKINREINPPWWQNFLKFVANNFFTILTLISLLFLTWKAWEFYQDITKQIETVKSLPSNAINNIQENTGDSIKDIINSLGF